MFRFSIFYYFVSKLTSICFTHFCLPVNAITIRIHTRTRKYYVSILEYVVKWAFSWFILSSINEVFK